MRLTRRPWPLFLILVLVMSLFVTGCGAKGLVSIAGLDKADLDLYVGDRYGNKNQNRKPGRVFESF